MLSVYDWVADGCFYDLFFLWVEGVGRDGDDTGLRGVRLRVLVLFCG